MSREIGQRVGAMRDADKDEVRMFGYGVYSGDEIPPVEFMMSSKMTNPKITLDNGSVVWGYQCWWGDEESVKEAIGKRQVVTVPVPCDES